LQKAFWRFEEIGCNWFLYKLMLQQLLYVWTSEPASELLSFSLSLSLKVANYVCLPACLPASSLPLCLRTNPASNLEAHWFSGFNRASHASARSRLCNCALIQPCVSCKRALSAVQLRTNPTSRGWMKDWMDGRIDWWPFCPL